MLAKSFLSALTAATLVTAQSSSACNQNTITINSDADAKSLSDNCRGTLTGTVVIANSSATEIDLRTIQTINGDLIVNDHKKLIRLSGASLSTITGKLDLQRLEFLSQLSLTNLRTVKEINWVALTALTSLDNMAITKAETVVVADTRIENLDGLDLVTVGNININNNARLQKFSSKLGNITTAFQASANAQGTVFEFPNLTWAANMTIANASTFSAPRLSKINGSIRFDSNFMQSFAAPNLTEVGSSFAFVGNSLLTNITAGSLTAIGGDLTIVNNTAMSSVDGLPKLKTIGGAILIRGNFTTVSLPALNDVKGAFNILSTADIKSSCEVFAKQAPTTQGGNGQIQGKYVCDGNFADANDPTKGSGGSSSGTNGSGAVAGTTVNMALLGLALVGGAVASFL